MERRGVAKRVRGFTSKLIVDEDKRSLAKQARLEALESGIDEDAFQVDDDDEEFEMEAEVDDEGSGAFLGTARGFREAHLCTIPAIKMWNVGKNKSRKKKSLSKKVAGFHGMPAAASFMVLLEESGMYESKIAEPHYLSAEADVEPLPPRCFCSVCGNISSYRCVRCREGFCSKRCQATHNQVQCVKITM